MNFFKRALILLLSFFLLSNVLADNHDTTEKDILEKAKEINQKVKEQQSKNSKASPEEPLPLNDPFAGDESLGQGGASVSVVSGSSEDIKKASLYNFKLIGIMTGEYESYVSLINSSGEIMTLQLHEELSENVKLVAIKPEEAVFQKEDASYLIINFKNQIRESLEAF